MGLKDGCVGSHVDLPVAWIDLALLSQCAGKLQEGIFTFYHLLSRVFLYYMPGLYVSLSLSSVYHE